ncbi:MAG: ABC transporter permease [Anaerolineae bacterium]
MSAFTGVVVYEYRMAVRRWGVWVAFLVTGIPFLVNAVLSGGQGAAPGMPIRQVAGSLAVSVNLLMPVVGGIAMADRLARDQRLGVRELLSSTPLSRPAYVLGKYTGVVLATVTPVLAILMVLAVVLVANGAPPALIPATLLAFLAINLPTYVFIGAFSLACPVVLPVRVYQVLFTGYWFWGNFVNPRAIPSISDTLLNSSGRYAASAFFLSDFGYALNEPGRTALDAGLNVAVLAACAAAALVALNIYLARQERLA